MANFPELAVWEDGVHQLTAEDPVQGGPDGVSNLPLKQLANRTAYLKEQLTGTGSGVDGFLVGVSSNRIGSTLEIREVTTLRLPTVTGKGQLLSQGFFDGTKRGGGVWLIDNADDTTVADHIVTVRDAAGRLWRRMWDDHALSATWAGVIADGADVRLFTLFATLADAQAIYGTAVLPAGTDLSAVSRDWAALQYVTFRALYDVGAAVEVPRGKLVLTDTYTIGALRNSDGYASGRVVGSATNYATGQLGTRLVPVFTDRPIVNVQAARMVEVARLYAQGIAPNGISRLTFSPDEADYYDAAWTVGRHNPYACFSVDGFCGADPGGGARYGSVGGYGRHPSYGVKFDHCQAGGAAVGLALSPGDDDENGEQIVWDGGAIEACCDAISSGNSQMNAFTIRNCNIDGVHTVFQGVKHGSQHSDMPAIENVIVTGAYQLFAYDLSWGDGKTVTNLKAEVVACIGKIGGWKTGGVTFNNAVIDLATGSAAGGFRYPLVHAELQCPVVFNGGAITVGHELVEGSAAFNIASYHPEMISFHGTCLIRAYEREHHALYSFQVGEGAFVASGVTNIDGGLGTQARDTESFSQVNTLPNRLPVWHNVRRLYTPTLASGALRAVRRNSTGNTMRWRIGTGAWAVDGANPMLVHGTITNLADAPLVMVGDYVLGVQVDCPFLFPSFVVRAIDAGTGVFTMQKLSTELDLAGSYTVEGANGLTLFVPTFVNPYGEAVASDIDGFVKQVDRLENFLVGDWVFGGFGGSGDEVPNRVTALAAASGAGHVTLARSSAVGPVLYNCKLSEVIGMPLGSALLPVDGSSTVAELEAKMNVVLTHLNK